MPLGISIALRTELILLIILIIMEIHSIMENGSMKKL